MIYINHPVYDLHDVPNLNKTIDELMKIYVHWKRFHWLICNIIYSSFNYNLNFLTLFKYLVFFAYFSPKRFCLTINNSLIYIVFFQYVQCGSMIS